MMKYFFLTIITILTISQASAQFGGGSTYDFLNLTSSARVNALGGNQVGMIDSSELVFSFYNPAALTPSMHNAMSLSYIDYLLDINYGYAAYAFHKEGIGTFSAGMQYANYGKFKEADEDGKLSGRTFTANDYALNLIYSRNVWNNFSAGINLKPIYSAYETYWSLGVAADLGISYIDSSGNFSAGIVAKNFGTQISTYLQDDVYEPLPFDLQAGFSQRLAHAPFRFNVTFHHLTNWQLTDYSTWQYDHKEEDDLSVVGRSDDFVKQFMRHVILGVEFIPTKNFVVGLGYNFQRRWEMSVKNNPAAVGLSGGFTVKVSKFRVSYAIASYHISGTSNVFSVSTNLSEFIR